MIKKKCSECKKLVRKPRRIHGKVLCHNCYSKEMTILRDFPMTITQAIQKVRIVKVSNSGGNGLEGCLYVPPILIGRKVKLVLVEDKDG